MKVYYNFSVLGLYYILRAKYYLFSTTRSDIYYFYSGKNKKVINLWHGMPIKKIAYDYKYVKELEDFDSIKTKIWNKFVTGSKYEDINMTISTSQFFTNFLITAFNNKKVYNYGLPRNDIFFLFNKDELKNNLNIKEKIIISYLPTHRNYGKGKINPYIFSGNSNAEKFFKENEVRILLKFHPNMKSFEEVYSKDSRITNISRLEFDPQELLAISDILITDYSSCYIDYLLLDRPIIFFHYDNYEEDDNELYFKINDYEVGPIVKNELELLEKIKNIISGKDDYKIERKKVRQIFHQFHDGKSSERLLNMLINGKHE